MKTIFLLAFSFLAITAQAGIEINTFKSPQQEADYNELVAELRCLVCQNQNLADSNAELAVDLRNEVYKMIDEGSSKQEILDFMVARYGDFVLYRPPVQSNTAVLWIGPFIILAIGALVAFIFVRRHRPAPENETKEISE
jgi:cytochrome c-type biogenesis protein CcmH